MPFFDNLTDDEKYIYFQIHSLGNSKSRFMLWVMLHKTQAKNILQALPQDIANELQIELNRISKQELISDTGNDVDIDIVWKKISILRELGLGGLASTEFLKATF